MYQLIWFRTDLNLIFYENYFSIPKKLPTDLSYFDLQIKKKICPLNKVILTPENIWTLIKKFWLLHKVKFYPK